MATLIDASVLIAAERGRVDLDVLLAEHGEEEIALAAITASELLHGVHRATKPEQRAQREAFVERLLADLPIISFDLVAARIHARLWAQLAAKGITVCSHDLLIGASAIAGNHNVATREERSFGKIPGLSLLKW